MHPRKVHPILREFSDIIILHACTRGKAISFVVCYCHCPHKNRQISISRHCIEWPALSRRQNGEKVTTLCSKWAPRILHFLASQAYQTTPTCIVMQYHRFWLISMCTYKWKGNIMRLIKFNDMHIYTWPHPQIFGHGSERSWSHSNSTVAAMPILSIEVYCFCPLVYLQHFHLMFGSWPPYYTMTKH